jgi:hypothetical protein
MSMPKLPQELIAKIREEVKGGKSRYDVAGELGISIVAVYRYTADLPKRRLKKLSKEEKDKIREKRKQGISTFELAKEYDVNPQIIYMIIRDLIDRYRKPSTSGNFCIRGRALEILQSLHKEGYYISKKGESTTSSFRTLSKYFSVKRVEVKHRTIYFLENKGDQALKAFMKLRCLKTIGYHELCAIAPLFGINISPREKRDLIGKNNPEEDDDFKNIKLKKQAFKGEQVQNFNDFGSFLHSELLYAM